LIWILERLSRLFLILKRWILPSRGPRVKNLNNKKSQTIRNSLRPQKTKFSIPDLAPPHNKSDFRTSMSQFLGPSAA
jgi:hypothetical protein